MWIARATEEANNLPRFPFSDSEASRKAVDEAKKIKDRNKKSKEGKLPKNTCRKMVVARPPSLGGHTMDTHTRGGKEAWRCLLCRLSSTSWKDFAPARCPGSAAARWSSRVVIAADKGEVTGSGHTRMISGDVVWCRNCGCYADAMARGLTAPCKGRPTGTNTGEG